MIYWVSRKWCSCLVLLVIWMQRVWNDGRASSSRNESRRWWLLHRALSKSHWLSVTLRVSTLVQQDCEDCRIEGCECCRHWVPSLMHHSRLSRNNRYYRSKALLQACICYSRCTWKSSCRLESEWQLSHRGRLSLSELRLQQAQLLWCILSSCGRCASCGDGQTSWW